MSLTNPPLSFHSVYEPRLDVDNERQWAILKGGQTVTPNRYPATSFSNSNWSFQINPPGKTIVMDRVIVIHVPVTITITATNTGTNQILQPGRFAFRSHPISSICTSMAAKINSAQCQMDVSQTIHCLEHFRTPMEYVRNHGSILPAMTDNYADYEDAISANNNPLGSYTDNSCQNARGSYKMTIVNGTTAATITADLYEYVYIPPFLYDGSEAGGLTHLDTFNLDCVLSGALPHILSMDLVTLLATGVTVTNVSVNFSQPELLVTWITPRIDQPIPPVIVYPYFNVARYISGTGTTTVAAQAQSTLVSNVMQFGSVPFKIYAYVRRSDADVQSSLTNMLSATDTFAQIRSVSIQFNNITGIMSSANQEELYQIALNNGLKMSFTEWMGQTQKTTATSSTVQLIGTTGSLLCFSPSKDFGLDATLADGVLGQFNFQLTANFTNRSKYAYPFELVIVAVTDGTLTISNQSTVIQIGVASSQDVLDSLESDMSYNQLEQVYGSGSFFSRVGDALKKGVQFARKHQLLSKGLSLVPLPGAQTASQVAQKFGFGYSPAGARGGVVVGGAEMGRNSLQKRIR